MKKKWKFIAVLVVVLSLVGAYDAYQYFTYNRYKERNYAIEPRAYEFIADRQGVAITWQPIDSKYRSKFGGYSDAIYGKKYIATDSYQFVHRFNDSDFDLKHLTWGEYWKIQVYDTSTDNLDRKEYDLLKAVQEYDDGYYPYDSYTYFVSYNNQEYRTIKLRKIGGGPGRLVLFNLGTGKVEDVPEGANMGGDGRTSIFVNYTSLKNYYSESMTNTNSSLSFPNSVIKQSSDWRLKEEYPKAYDLMTKQGGQLYLLTDKTDPKLMSDIYSLLIPKDKQLFDNLTVYGSVTKDGQDHVVNSYEEFISVLKLEEQDSK